MDVDLDKLFLYRRKAGLTQKEVAQILGFKAGLTYQRIEKGLRPLRASHLLILAQVYGVPLSDLIKEREVV